MRERRLADASPADRAFLADVVEGLKTYVNEINGLQLTPGGRTLVFLACVGIRNGDGTTTMRITCNVGHAGQDEIVAMLAKLPKAHES